MAKKKLSNRDDMAAIAAEMKSGKMNMRVREPDLPRVSPPSRVRERSPA